MKLKQLFIPTIVFLLLSISFISMILVYLILPGPLEETKNIIIYNKTSTKIISRNLKNENIINYPWAFNLVTKLYGLAGRHLKSGEYAFTPQITPIQVIKILASGKSIIHKLPVLEGVTIHEVIEKLRNEPLLTGEIEENFTEGFLMPATYFYSFGDSRQKLLSQMKQLMSEALDEIMPKLQQNSPLKTRLDVITLASIVEKEALLDSEKPIIAAVFINRLKKNMKLQADPTTIYAITMGQYKLNRPISKADLKNNSKYNTYHIYGLPPSPISCPSRKSLEAVVNPANTNVLYFVATGSGSHNFSGHLNEHNMNVENYRKNKNR